MDRGNWSVGLIGERANPEQHRALATIFRDRINILGVLVGVVRKY